MEDNAKLSHHHHHPQHSSSSSSSSSMTLFSRLDHLDFVMKYLEKKQRFERMGGSNSEGGMERRCISLDVALKDTYFKGSILDRVAALEHRLFQLCVEIDSSNPSSLATSTQTAAEQISCSSPKQFCRGEPSSSSSSSSYPTFHYPSHGGPSKVSQLQEKPQRHQQIKKKQQSPSKVQLGKTETEKDHEGGSCKNVKKVIPPSKWPHLRLFGC